MDYKVYTKSLELTPAIEDYILKRMAKPDRMLRKHEDLVSPAEFRIDKEGGIYKVEITTHFKSFNKIVKVNEKSGDLYEAIDKVTDSIERKIRKLKARLQDHVKINQKAFSKINFDVFNFNNDDEEFEKQDIVKRKRHDLSIMSSEEALLQTEMLGHNFFIFRNSETEEVNVIYKKNEHKYGIIEFNG
jgi:putative sigma-54 modulation protein